jgi:protein-tyrosine phosphatase
MDRKLKNLNIGNESPYDMRQQFTDIHCHCLPGLDDGPKDLDEAVLLCQRLIEENISTVIATPHLLGRYDDCSNATQIRKACSDLEEVLSSKGIELDILPGAEVRIDERIHQLLDSDEILTLADAGRYILLEFPHEVFLNIEPLLSDLASIGIEAIISHLEINLPFEKYSKVLSKWIEYPVHMQIDAASLLGDYGPRCPQHNFEKTAYEGSISEDK